MGHFSSSQNSEHLGRILFHPHGCSELCEILLFQRPLQTATALYCDPSGQLHIFPVFTTFHSCCFHFLLASAKSSSVPRAFFSWAHQTLDYCYYSKMPSFPAHMLRFIKWASPRLRVFISCELGFHPAPVIVGEHCRQSWHSPRLTRSFYFLSQASFFLFVLLLLDKSSAEWFAC